MRPPILRYFTSDHLPHPLADVADLYAKLAGFLADSLPPGPETSVALRKLLESKDAAVRAALDIPAQPTEED
jgi:hypothetical protein